MIKDFVKKHRFYWILQEELGVLLLHVMDLYPYLDKDTV